MIASRSIASSRAIRFTIEKTWTFRYTPIFALREAIHYPAVTVNGSDEYRSKCRFFASASDTATASADPYDRYRSHAAIYSEDIMKDLLEESKRTLQATDPQVYQQVLEEINRAAATTVALDVPELGPTGRYLYYYETADEHNISVEARQYRRRSQKKTHFWKESPAEDNLLDASESELVLLESRAGTSLQAVSLSVDESMVAFIMQDETSNQMESQLWVRYITTGEQIRVDTGLLVPWVVEFGPQEQHNGKHGSHALSWVTVDEVGRPATAHVAWVDYSERLTCSSSSVLYHSTDPSVHVDVQRCKGCRYLAVHARTQTANETYLLGPSYKETGMQLVRAFEQGVQYHIDVGTRNDVVLLVSRDEKDESITDSSYLNLEYSLGETTVDFLPIEDDWGRNLVVLKTGYVMTDMDLFQDFVVVYERSTLDARQRIRLTERLSSREEWIVPIPEADAYVAVLSPAGNMHYESDSVRFFLESPAEPRKTYEYHVPSRRLSLLSKDRSGEADIVQERTVVSSQDGTLVPLTLVYRKETQNSKATEALPAVLIGYGAYGQSVNLAFDPATRPLLDRGFLLAYAHTRGGGELGKSWHRRGRLYEKGRAVDDYLACAEALTNYTLVDKPVRLAARAFSAGGVIAGAAVNRRPDLFSAAALTNPFLDVEATLKNESLHLTRHEWDEYGNPLDDALAANTIASYCPVANANGGQHLPKFLLIGTMDDKEVPVWNPVVFGKKAREQARGRPDTDVLLYIVGQGGHRLVGARSHVAALEVAFILRSMNTASYS